MLIASGAMPDTMTGSKESLNLGTNLVPPYLSPGDWTGGCCSNCFDNIDLISEHFYNYGNTHFSLAEGQQVPNDPNEPVTDWMRRPANHIRIKYEEYKEYEKLLPELVAHPKPLNIDEWAYWTRRRSVIRFTRPTPGCSMKCSGTPTSFKWRLTPLPPRCLPAMERMSR